MRTPLFLLSLALTLLLGNVQPAAAAACDPSGTACATFECPAAKIGTSQLDFGKQNLIICLVDGTSSTGYRWKNQTSGGASVAIDYGNCIDVAAGGCRVHGPEWHLCPASQPIAIGLENGYIGRGCSEYTIAVRCCATR